MELSIRPTIKNVLFNNKKISNVIVLRYYFYKTYTTT